MSDLILALAALAWPTGLIAAGIYFRHDIRKILRGGWKLKTPSGHEVIFGEGQFTSVSTIPPPGVADTIKRLDMEGRATPTHSAIEQRTNTLRSQLKSFKRSEDITEFENLLLVHLADAQLYGGSLRIYIQIFRSQLDALRRMAETRSKVDLVPFHKIHEERVVAATQGWQNPAPPLDFTRWSSFLKETDLCSIDGEYGSITMIGDAFLHYITVAQLPEKWNY